MILDLLKTYFIIYFAYNLMYYIGVSSVFTFILLLVRKVTNGYLSPILDEKRECFWYGFMWPYYTVKLIVQAIYMTLRDKKK